MSKHATEREEKATGSNTLLCDGRLAHRHPKNSKRSWLSCPALACAVYVMPSAETQYSYEFRALAMAYDTMGPTQTTRYDISIHSKGPTGPNCFFLARARFVDQLTPSLSLSLCASSIASSKESVSSASVNDNEKKVCAGRRSHPQSICICPRSYFVDSLPKTYTRTAVQQYRVFVHKVLRTPVYDTMLLLFVLLLYMLYEILL